MAETKHYEFDEVRLIFHEFKTPLSSIKLLVDMASATSGDPIVQRTLEKALASINRLSATVDAFLDAASIEIGKLEVASVDIGELISQEIDLVEPVARNRGIEIAFTRPDQPVGIEAPPHALQSIITNLLMNAIKYNRENGTVTVTLHTGGKDLRISVRDQGAGIAERDQHNVFLPLYRSRAAKQSIEGSGLGLTLVQRLVEGLGGRVWFDSVEGEGTTFFVDLPLAPDMMQDPQEATDGVRDHLQEGSDRYALNKDRDQSPAKT